MMIIREVEIPTHTLPCLLACLPASAGLPISVLQMLKIWQLFKFRKRVEILNVFALTTTDADILKKNLVHVLVNAASKCNQ